MSIRTAHTEQMAQVTQTRVFPASRSEPMGGNAGSKYLADIQRFAMLEREHEYDLAKRWRDKGDRSAAHELVTSHLRLAARIARNYRGYGLPLTEVTSEANMGLMQAVDRFEPDKGFRFSTYAIWWIRAAIQDYILRSWSLVKIGTTTNQRKLFFKLRSAKSKIAAFDNAELRPDQVRLLATNLGVSDREVTYMNRRLGGDMSLNAPFHEEDSTVEWVDMLADETPSPEEIVVKDDETDHRRRALVGAIDTLNERERRIFEARHLAEKPQTLEELADEFNVSRERIRQIEVRAFEKVRTATKKRVRERTAPSPAWA